MNFYSSLISSILIASVVNGSYLRSYDNSENDINKVYLDWGMEFRSNTLKRKRKNKKLLSIRRDLKPNLKSNAIYEKKAMLDLDVDFDWNNFFGMSHSLGYE